ncbi:M61 family metallopeptidase [Asticcacaulis sp. AC466]|uniref:M61 family metallopeptidase n=1 Tax=Asticcacaulis sp. AC466 TaxID=1282362 RepID=UPI0004180932|nr:M61 family metallopeptidase [Asticcacaulis sp. AC466]
MKKTVLGFVSAIALSVGMIANTAGAQTMAPPDPVIAPPQDIAYPGVLKVSIDATDLDRKIFSVKETVPVGKAGDLILMLPKWLPGHHSDRSEISKIAGLMVSANGKPLTWVRDQIEVTAFHINVPEGVTAVDVEFQYLAPTTAAAGRQVMTPDMLNLQFDFASLYPAGYYAKRIPIQATVTFPEGWGYATGLETDSKTGNTVAFKETDYDTLIDSPIFAGRYFKTWDLDPGGPVPVRLNVVADSPEQLDALPAFIDVHKKLVQQAYKLYGSHHYNHYDFLVAASDQLGGIGLEHHRSSENRVEKKYLTEAKVSYSRDLLAHEYTHSWNGKFRRGADLWTPNFQVPMRNSLLWVYEGQTQYWGQVLAARSGLNTKELALQNLALTAANYDNLPGRKWRALQDTTNDPVISARAPQNWTSYQRSEDYYNEGLLIWLDADTLIREKTKGKKSLDVFAHDFFGIQNGEWGEATYTFDDVVKTLNGVYPYDWATFLRTRLDGHGEANNGGAPLDGITRGGYKLVYTETPSDLYKGVESIRKVTNLNYSIGFSVSNKDNTLTSVLWGSAAFNAGLTPGDTLVAINGRTYDNDAMKRAITEAKSGKPIELIVKMDETYRVIKVTYTGGLRYPVLQRVEGTPALLDDILAEKK